MIAEIDASAVFLPVESFSPSGGTLSGTPDRAKRSGESDFDSGEGTDDGERTALGIKGAEVERLTYRQPI
jgi:hypothetical protein